jgi:hypothetical protein
MTFACPVHPADVSDPPSILRAVDQWPEDWRVYFDERVRVLLDRTLFVYLSARRCAYKDTVSVTAREGVNLDTLTR